MTKRRRFVDVEPIDTVMDEVRNAAREAGGKAIGALCMLAFEAKSESVRLAAIKELLDRGFGRPGAAPSESAGGVTAHLLVDDGYAN